MLISYLFCYSNIAFFFQTLHVVLRTYQLLISLFYFNILIQFVKNYCKYCILVFIYTDKVKLLILVYVLATGICARIMKREKMQRIYMQGRYSN